MHSLPTLESLHEPPPPRLDLHNGQPTSLPPHLTDERSPPPHPSSLSSQKAFMEIHQLEQQGHLDGHMGYATNTPTHGGNTPLGGGVGAGNIRSPYTSAIPGGPGSVPLPEYATRSPLAGYPFSGIPPLSSGYAPPPPPHHPTFGLSHYQSPPLGLGKLSYPSLLRNKHPRRTSVIITQLSLIYYIIYTCIHVNIFHNIKDIYFINHT